MQHDTNSSAMHNNTLNTTSRSQPHCEPHTQPATSPHDTEVPTTCNLHQFSHDAIWDRLLSLPTRRHRETLLQLSHVQQQQLADYIKLLQGFIDFTCPDNHAFVLDIIDLVPKQRNPKAFWCIMKFLHTYDAQRLTPPVVHTLINHYGTHNGRDEMHLLSLVVIPGSTKTYQEHLFIVAALLASLQPDDLEAVAKLHHAFYHGLWPADWYQNSLIMLLALRIENTFIPYDDANKRINASYHIDKQLLSDREFIQTACVLRPEILTVASHELRTHTDIIRRMITSCSPPNCKRIRAASMIFLCNNDNLKKLIAPLPMNTLEKAKLLLRLLQQRNKALMMHRSIVDLLSSHLWLTAYLFNQAPKHKPTPHDHYHMLNQSSFSQLILPFMENLQRLNHYVAQSLRILYLEMTNRSRITQRDIDTVLPLAFWTQLLRKHTNLSPHAQKDLLIRFSKDKHQQRPNNPYATPLRWALKHYLLTWILQNQGNRCEALLADWDRNACVQVMHTQLARYYHPHRTHPPYENTTSKTSDQTTCITFFIDLLPGYSAPMQDHVGPIPLSDLHVPKDNWSRLENECRFIIHDEDSLHTPLVFRLHPNLIPTRKRRADTNLPCTAFRKKPSMVCFFSSSKQRCNAHNPDA